MSLFYEGCPSSFFFDFQGTAWQTSLWIWLKACLIEFWYVIKSSNKSAQIPLQLTIQDSWARKANYDEVIISAKGSSLNCFPPVLCRIFPASTYSTLKKGQLSYDKTDRSHKCHMYGFVMFLCRRAIPPQSRWLFRCAKWRDVSLHTHKSAPSRKIILSVCSGQLGLGVISVNNPSMCRKWLYWFNMDLEHHPHHLAPSLIWLINYIPCDLSMPSDCVLGACNLVT